VKGASRLRIPSGSLPSSLLNMTQLRAISTEHKTKRNETKQNKTKQIKTNQNNTTQNKTKQNITKQQITTHRNHELRNRNSNSNSCPLAKCECERERETVPGVFPRTPPSPPHPDPDLGAGGSLQRGLHGTPGGLDRGGERPPVFGAGRVRWMPVGGSGRRNALERAAPAVGETVPDACKREWKQERRRRRRQRLWHLPSAIPQDAVVVIVVKNRMNPLRERVSQPSNTNDTIQCNTMQCNALSSPLLSSPLETCLLIFSIYRTNDAITHRHCSGSKRKRCCWTISKHACHSSNTIPHLFRLCTKEKHNN